MSFRRRVRSASRLGLAAAVLWVGASPSVLGQPAGTLQSGAETYYDTLPGESANGIALNFTQLLPVSGSSLGDLTLVNRAGHTTIGRFMVRVQDLSFRDFRLGAGAGDMQERLDAAPFHFSNDYVPLALLRGVSLHAEKPDLKLSLFGGRNELFRGVQLPETSFAPESFLGFAGAAARAGGRMTLDFETMHTRSEIEADNPLFGVPAPRDAHTYTVGLTARPIAEWVLSARGSLAQYTYPDDSIYKSGHFLSFVAGSAFEGAAWKAQADYMREGVNYVPLSTASVGNREGPFTLVQFAGKRFSAYGSYASYQNNLEGNIGVPDLRSEVVLFSPSMRLWQSVMVTASYAKQDLSSIRDGVLSRFSQRTVGAETSFPSFGSTRVRYQRQSTDEPTLRQRLDEIEIEQRPPPFHGVSVYGGVKGQRSDVAATSLLYRAGIDGSIGEIHAFFDGEWGKDLASSSSVFSLNRNQTIRFGLSAPLPKALELRVEGYRNRLSAVVNPESIFVANPTQAELFSFNRTSFLVRVAKSWQWGQAPQRAGSGATLPGAYPFGDVSGVIFRDSNANGVRDPGEAGVPGIAVRLDGGQLGRTDPTGRFFFPNVVEGEHHVELMLDELPVSFNPPAVLATTVRVARFKAGGHEFGLIPTSRLTGRVEQELASGERRPFADAVLTLLPGNFSTYSHEDGVYSFENLPPGRYAVRLEDQTLPDGAIAGKVLSDDVELKADEERAVDPFVFELTIEEKPIQPVLQNEQIISPPRPVKRKPSGNAASDSSGHRRR